MKFNLIRGIRIGFDPDKSGSLIKFGWQDTSNWQLYQRMRENKVIDQSERENNNNNACYSV